MDEAIHVISDVLNNLPESDEELMNYLNEKK